MGQFRVAPLRATGLTPESVAQNLEGLLNAMHAEGWKQSSIEPIVYNSSTTGYLLVIFVRVESDG